MEFPVVGPHRDAARPPRVVKLHVDQASTIVAVRSHFYGSIEQHLVELASLDLPGIAAVAVVVLPEKKRI